MAVRPRGGQDVQEERMPRPAAGAPREVRQDALRHLEVSLTRLCERFPERRPRPLSQPQLQAIRFLMSHGPDTIGSLARAIGVSVSSATGVIDRLAQLNLVRRVRPERDRRTVEVSVTDKGVGMARQIVQDRVDVVDRLFGHLSPDDLTRLDELIRRGLEQAAKAVEVS